MIRSLQAALLAACLLCAPATAAPALFLIKGGQAPIYLFGSIHAMPRGLDWRTDALDAAFEAADECWFEALNANVDAAALLSLAAALDPLRPLANALDPEDYALLESRVEGVVPGAMPLVNRMSPWVAAMFALIDASSTLLNDTVEGPDFILMREADTEGKPTGALENVAGVLRIFNTIPRPRQLEMLKATLHLPQGQPSVVKAFADHWMNGDLDALAAVYTTAGSTDPFALDTLLQHRNEAWLPKILALLDQDKTILITVGAGHLVGPGNLRDLLEQRGYHLERLQ